MLALITKNFKPLKVDITDDVNEFLDFRMGGRLQKLGKKVDELVEQTSVDNKKIIQLQSQLLQKEKEVSELKEVLKELVSLKMLKDSEGKTEDYLIRQPTAWERAMQHLKQQP